MLCDRLWTDARLMTASPHLPGLGIIEKGAIATTQGRIVFAGPSHDLPANLEARETIPLSGRWVTPGFVDCHTHLIHAGNRSREFELRLAGATYEQIANEGGGILSTVKATRAATEEELVSLALPRLDDLIAEGVTTIEIKSGYGLTLEDELKQLRAARRLEHQRSISVTTTLLAAHTVSPEFSKQRQAYLNLIVDEILPRGIAEGLVDAVDAFCEKIAFTPEESAFLFEKARQLGIPIKLHADQLSDLGGAALAARFHALSADHLEFTNEESVQAMASAGTVAVLLPGAFYFLRETQLPPLAAFRKHGIPMALATDMNPGSSPLTSLLLTLNFAATLFRMTVEECLLAVTRNGAKALGQLQHVGTIEVGKWCDLAIWEIERLAELVYRLGANPLHRRVWRGQ